MKPYMPSNGTEGMAFEDRWCSRCARDCKYQRTNDGKDGCGILMKALCGIQPREWVKIASGPACLGFRVRTAGPQRRPPGWSKVPALPGVES